MSISAPSLSSPGKGETVLLVEDAGALRALIARLLELRGYRVLVASSGEAALQIWQHERRSIDLLLSDVVMKGAMTGSDVLACLRADNPKLKAILSSGYASAILPEVQLGENTAFLAKPYPPEQLYKLVRELLDRAG